MNSLRMAKLFEERIPEYIRTISPYVPGKPVEEVERELKIRAVKLASNENALGPSPRAMEAVRSALSDANRYPDGDAYYLREALAAKHGVPMENIVVGLGSSELIDLSARLLIHLGEEGITSQGSFALYYIAIQATGGRLVALPLRDYAFDLNAMARAISLRTRYVILANPNNPTGTLFTADEFDDFLARVPEDVLVVIDEAYCDYVSHPNYTRAIERVRDGRNLLVLRTFSKAHGLAGMRIGYGIGPAPLVSEMNKVRTPFNTSGVAQAAALAAMGDVEHVQRSVESNREGMARVTQGLDRLGVRFVPSFGNFIYLEAGASGRALADALLERGVIVRPLDWMGIREGVRVTIGTSEENEKFLAALAKAVKSRQLAPAR
ncbi:MAG TPA: histidinol-phosphate transaminase [Candidatus Acidoferrales bacterium]|nr:histidinol-phosphate transaminase [Candidatus Acidoferrales bacterium]